LTVSLPVISGMNMKKRFIYITISACIFAASFLLITRHAVRSNAGEIRREKGEVLEATQALEAIRWYNSQRAYPSGKIPVDWREKAISHIQKYNFQKTRALTSLSWISVGPNNIAGRVRSIIVDPLNTNIVYCGSVSGGLWRSTDIGASWNPINDFLPNLVVGCLAIDHSNVNIIYAGTGEGYANVDALRGIGILKSVDRGQSWTVLNKFTPITDTVNSYFYINKIIIRPDKPGFLFAALSNRDAGIWKSTNSGTTWSPITSVGKSPKYCTDLVIDEAHPDTMYAAFGLVWPDGIYRTFNGGSSWTKLTTGFPPEADNYHRIGLTICKSNPSILYASVADKYNYTHSIMKTTDCGNHWFAVAKPFDTSVGVDSSHLGGQGWYNNVIAVNPSNPNLVYAGGINLFRTTNGGTSWGRISDGYGSPYVHVDQHAIVFNPQNPMVIYFGNDGGIYRAIDNGTVTFTDINKGFVTAQFYSGAVNPSSEIYYGGTQDNGTIKTTSPPSWSQVLGGDGGATAVDYSEPSTVYTEYVYLCFQKSTNGGSSWTRMMNGIPTSGPDQGDGTSDRCLFIAPVAMDPTNPKILAAGTYKMYYTTNGGITWDVISKGLINNGDMTGDGNGANQVGSHDASISAIAIAKSSSATIYAGTSGSARGRAKVWVTTNTGANWSDVSKSPLPDRYVSAIAVDPADKDRAIACFSGYGAGHVFMTRTRGSRWQNMSGNLPDVPVNAAVIDPLNSNHVIIGTDIGIFESVDSASWVQQNTNMANVSVDDLDLRADGYLFAATHGRGMFKSARPVWVTSRLSLTVHQNPVLTPYLDIYVTSQDALVSGPSMQVSVNGGTPQSARLDTISPRVYKGNYEFTQSGTITISVTGRDSSGQTVSAARTFQAQLMKPGFQQTIQAPDGGALLSASAEAVTEDMYFTLVPEEGSKPPSPLIGQAYTFGPVRQFSGGGLTVTLTYNSDLLAGREERFLSVYKYSGSGWVPVESRVDVQNKTVSAGIFSLGKFALGYNDNRPERAFPESYALYQNYPNPFNPSTKIIFAIPEAGRVVLKIYNSAGQEVKTLLDAERTAGQYEAAWDGRSNTGGMVSSGIYFYRLIVKANDILKYDKTGKMALLK